MRVRFTPIARGQFLAALAYMGRDDAAAARRFRRRAEQVLRRLERFARSGRHLPEIPDLPHREVILRPYRFFYRIKGQTVWIMAVWHSAQLAKPTDDSNAP